MKKHLTVGVLVGFLSTAVFFSSAAADGAEAHTVRVVVKIDPSAPIEEIADGAGAIETRPLIPSRGLHEVSGPPVDDAKDAEHDAKKLAHELEHDDAVVWAEPDIDDDARDDRFHAWPLGEPTVAATTGLTDQPAFASLGLPEAHGVATGRDVVVAVLDSGIDRSHPLLAGSVLPGYDLVDDDGDPSEVRNGEDDDGNGVADDAFGHGTFVAGVIRQVAPGAQILPLRVLDDEGRGEFYAIAEGIDVAIESGADIINLSLGVGDKEHGKLLKDVLKRARKADVAVVAAAGNVGSDEHHFPAATKDVIGVTALDEHGSAVADFAGRGKWVDVAAPGIGIVSSMADGGFVRWDGTSMATPVVTAQLALMIEAVPDDDVKHLEKRLWKSCRKMEKKGLTYRGIVDLLESLR